VVSVLFSRGRGGKGRDSQRLGGVAEAAVCLQVPGDPSYDDARR
jgi:hypothetical protein